MKKKFLLFKFKFFKTSKKIRLPIIPTRPDRDPLNNNITKLKNFKLFFLNKKKPKADKIPKFKGSHEKPHGLILSLSLIMLLQTCPPLSIFKIFPKINSFKENLLNFQSINSNSPHIKFIKIVIFNPKKKYFILFFFIFFFLNQ